MIIIINSSMSEDGRAREKNRNPRDDARGKSCANFLLWMRPADLKGKYYELNFKLTLSYFVQSKFVSTCYTSKGLLFCSNFLKN